MATYLYPDDADPQVSKLQTSRPTLRSHRLRRGEARSRPTQATRLHANARHGQAPLLVHGGHARRPVVRRFGDGCLLGGGKPRRQRDGDDPREGRETAAAARGRYSWWGVLMRWHVKCPDAETGDFLITVYDVEWDEMANVVAEAERETGGSVRSYRMPAAIAAIGRGCPTTSDLTTTVGILVLLLNARHVRQHPRQLDDLRRDLAEHERQDRDGHDADPERAGHGSGGASDAAIKSLIRGTPAEPVVGGRLGILSTVGFLPPQERRRVRRSPARVKMCRDAATTVPTACFGSRRLDHGFRCVRPATQRPTPSAPRPPRRRNRALVEASPFDRCSQPAGADRLRGSGACPAVRTSGGCRRDG